MKRFASSLLALCLAVPAFAGPMKFDAKKFSNTGKMAKKLTAGKNKKTNYGFHKQDESVFALKEPVTSTVDIGGQEKGSVDMKKYDEALFEIVDSVIAMLDHSLKQGKG